MKRLSKRTLITFAIATVVGALLHFLHALAPNFVTALFSPVNESLWEHLKIIFWPLVVSALVLTKGGEKGDKGPWALAILIAGAGMLGIGYVYHVIVGGEALVFDIFLYVLMMALAFVLAGVLDRPAIRDRADMLVLLVLVLGCVMILFTFLPPDMALFADMSGANTWARIPC